MTTLLELKDALKSYGGQTLLDHTDLTLSDEYKVGFIGRNGAGKSTLCKILLGEETLDSGEYIQHPSLRLGYLYQHDPFQPDESALEFLMRDSGQPDWRCGQVAGQFELKNERLTCPIGELSGGWQTRVKLAALLLHDPNLLLLDEPTNFLDLRTQILLENFLRDLPLACLIVSHDRSFLKATCDHTLELSRGELTMYSGDIEAFLEMKEEKKERDLRYNANIRAKQRQLQTFIDKNRAGANTASQARSKAKQLARLETVDIEQDEATVNIRVPQVEPRKGSVLRCTDLAIGYEDGHPVADGIDLDLEYGERIAVVGDNGQGKTTFLRTIVGSLPELGGNVKWGHHVDIGTYAQHVYTSLPEDMRVLEYLESQALPETTTQQIMEAAGSFLFRDAHLKKPISVLSGGERARLCLSGILLGKSTVLILDEPGNHLDVETVDALANALRSYEGTIIFTSHDRHFMQKVATTVVEVRDRRVVNYPGSYEDYLYRVRKEIEEGQRDTSSSQSESHKPASKQTGKVIYETSKEQKKVERKIEKLDQQRQEINEKFLSVTDHQEAQKLQAELQAVNAEISQLEETWMELQTELDQVAD
jgi:ATP-binding cassette subfamily F protein 3